MTLDCVYIIQNLIQHSAMIAEEELLVTRGFRILGNILDSFFPPFSKQVVIL